MVAATETQTQKASQIRRVSHFNTYDLLGMALVLSVGLIHLVYAPEEYDHVEYIGVLFVANFVLSLAAAVGIALRNGWGWLAGLVAAAGSIVGYVVSRTAGLPGHPIEPWLEPAGVLSLTTEGFFTLLAYIVWGQRAAGTERAQQWIIETLRLDRLPGGWFHHDWVKRNLMPSATLLGLAAVGLASAIWLSGTEDFTQFDLGNDYGLFVSRVNTTMLDSIVDVRLKIVDAEKARRIFSDHDKMPYLLVEDGDKTVKLYAPGHSRHASTPIEGRIYAFFFPNPDGVIKSGTTVSLIFGRKKLEPIQVR